jgi:nucleoside-diphosphate-sugar epimerase
MDIAEKKLKIKHIPGPLGVRGRNSDNKLIKEKLEWEPDYPLKKGLEKTYLWISNQISEQNKENYKSHNCI